MSKSYEVLVTCPDCQMDPAVRDECKAAHTRQMMDQRARRVARLAAGDPTIIIDHGSESTYNNWRCRCDPCKAAHSVVQARYRQARRQP